MGIIPYNGALFYCAFCKPLHCPLEFLQFYRENASQETGEITTEELMFPLPTPKNNCGCTFFGIKRRKTR